MQPNLKRDQLIFPKKYITKKQLFTNLYCLISDDWDDSFAVNEIFGNG